MKAKISAQAQTVLDILAAKRCHLTADEILEGLDGIGTATVYRALDHLTEIGLIRRLSLREEKRRYTNTSAPITCISCVNSAEACTISRRIYRHGGGSRECCGHRVNWCEVTAHGVAGLPEQAKASTGEG